MLLLSSARFCAPLYSLHPSTVSASCKHGQTLTFWSNCLAVNHLLWPRYICVCVCACVMCLLAVWGGVHVCVCVCGCVISAAAGRRPYISHSPDLLCFPPSHSWRRAIRANANHSNHFCMITKFSFSCWVSIFFSLIYFVLTSRRFIEMFPRFLVFFFFWGGWVPAESARTNSAKSITLLQRNKSSNGASHLHTGHNRLL